MAESWNGTVEYEANDIVSYNGRLYFALRDSIGKQPAGYSVDYYPQDVAFWTTDEVFTWEPSYEPNLQFKPKTRQFNDNMQIFQNVRADGINTNPLILELTFDIRDNNETEAILTFLRNRKGAYSFSYTLPSPYSATRKFICKNFGNNMKFYDNNTITATFEEIL